MAVVPEVFYGDACALGKLVSMEEYTVGINTSRDVQQLR